MASTGTVPCAKAGPMTQATTTGSTVIQQQVSCTLTAGPSSTEPGMASGLMAGCVAVGFGIQDIMPGSTALQKMVICAITAGEP